jgi:hypothetical protein
MSLLSCGPPGYLFEVGDIFGGLSARSTSATWLLLIENTKAAPAGKPYNFSGLLEGANKYRAESKSAPSRAYYRSSGCSAGNGCQVAKFLQNGSGYRAKAADAYVGLTQKREGEFSCEISPSHFRFSEIRLGFQITTLVIPESLGTHERQPVLLPHSSVPHSSQELSFCRPFPVTRIEPRCRFSKTTVSPLSPSGRSLFL